MQILRYLEYNVLNAVIEIRSCLHQGYLLDTCHVPGTVLDKADIALRLPWSTCAMMETGTDRGITEELWVKNHSRVLWDPEYK